MKDSNTEEFLKTLEEAQSSMKALLDNQSNFNKVADYCENIFLNAEDTNKAVEESKSLTAQALASVAYQINALATSMLRLLDNQTTQLKQMESSINLLSLTVDIFKQKVAWQQIGVLTAPCQIPCVEKIVPPARVEESSTVYERMPISYTNLDSIGHGLWDGKKSTGKTQPEPQTTVQQPSTHQGGHHFGSSIGIAVPPPSAPKWSNFKTADLTSATPVSSVPQTPSVFSNPTPPPPPSPRNVEGLPPPPPPPPFLQGSPLSTDTSSASPFSPAFIDTFVPPPPTPQNNFSTLFLPSPLPPPPPLETDFGAPPPPPPLFGVPQSPNVQYASMAPPPPHIPSSGTGKGHVAPPPPRRSAVPVGGAPPPPPPPPPPPAPGKAYIPPPPPPPF